ncbi:MAG TPA: class I SAM-dependent methyltransferase [Ktedonobacteraceae bacterium]|nr:class I SAM-dependent methyltransferase [Ktedonobacteraceae bacterium]
MTNDYDQIAPFYDVEHAHFDEDVDLYMNFAELRGGPLLELACGSGRLLLPLARAGYEVTGVDTSPAMLALARVALETEGLMARCKLAQQDMCALQLDKKFHLAFIALGSFGHVITRRAQQQALTAIRAHLTAGGTFILDISNEDARYMENMGGQMLHQGTWQLDDGSMVTHFISPASSSTMHLLDLTHFYDVHKQGETVRRTITRTQLYLFERNEAQLLLEQAGFTVKDVYGNYDLSQYEHDSPRMIFVAEAR